VSHSHLPSFPTRRSSDLEDDTPGIFRQADFCRHHEDRVKESCEAHVVFFKALTEEPIRDIHQGDAEEAHNLIQLDVNAIEVIFRSEEHTSELQSLAYLVC